MFYIEDPENKFGEFFKTLCKLHDDAYDSIYTTKGIVMKLAEYIEEFGKYFNLEKWKKRV